MEKNTFNFEKRAFSGKGRQSLHIIINVKSIRKMLISCIKFDHALYSINYVITTLSRIYLFSSGVAEELSAGGVAVRVDPCQCRAGHLPHNH